MQQVVINSLNTAIVLLNHELEVMLINQAAESLLDLSEKQVLGQKLPAKLPGWKDVESLLYESLQTDQIYTKRQTKFISLDRIASPLTSPSHPSQIMSGQGCL